MSVLPGSDDQPVRRVLVVSKTHLDVGFTDLAALVRRRYLDDFFPRAMAVAAELRAAGGPARLRWTTGSWILAEALEAADARRRAALENAIDAGDLCWHALPFTTHTEYADRSLMAHGLSISAELDRRYDRRTRAAKMTDVPGHTRALVSLLADRGVDFLHIGVNPASSSPAVPEQFRWHDLAASGRPVINVMYQPGGYGAVQRIAGTDVVVAVELTGDNLGPRAAAAIVERFDSLADQFPGAVVTAATFDEVAAVMATASGALPAVDAEIGDSWLHGVASDPVKTAGFRALCRLRRDWLTAGRIDREDEVLRAASTRLLLVAEHTWGLDQKTHWPDETHWSATQLAARREDPDTVRFESSWAEQRRPLEEFVDILRTGGHDQLSAEARAALEQSRTPRSSLSTRSEEHHLLDPDDPRCRLGRFEVSLDPDDGAIIGLDTPDGRSLAAATSPLARFWLQTFDVADFERWYATYNAGTIDSDQWWARWDNTKPGLEHSGARSASWRPTLLEARIGRRDELDELVVELGPPSGDVAPDQLPVAWPARLTMSVSASRAGGPIRFEVIWCDAPAARWPAATWWQFAPVVSDPRGWRMSKLSETVAPDEVVAGGGRQLHVVDELGHPDGIRIRPIDTGLVAPGAPRLLHWDDQPVDLSAGWHVCALANLWGTNFPMWAPGDARVRVEMTVDET